VLSPVVETIGLTRWYGRVLAVDHLNLTVPQGSVYGFLGPNGAGKSTTIRLLLGVLGPNEGRVELFGEPLRRNRRDLLRRVGSLIEEPSLYPNLTGAENMEVARRMVGATRTRRPWPWRRWG
jgi:ABC-type multidrug transport system ATPase subunit